MQTAVQIVTPIVPRATKPTNIEHHKIKNIFK